MLIDWFTVGAQIFNFLLLVWLMRRFLYKPILHVIDEREKRIAAELAGAEDKKSEAQRESSEFQRKNQEFDAQRTILWSKVVDEANAERQRRLDETLKAVEILGSKRQETLKNEEHNLLQEIRHRTQQEVFSISRKALNDLASASLEERLCEVFTRRLRELNGQDKADIAEAIKKMSGVPVVRSVFDLPSGQRAEIQRVLNETFSAENKVQFETAPDLIGGIELFIDGHKVEWSIADYLTSLEKSVDEILQEKGHPAARTETATEGPESEARS